MMLCGWVECGCCGAHPVSGKAHPPLNKHHTHQPKGRWGTHPSKGGGTPQRVRGGARKGWPRQERQISRERPRRERERERKEKGNPKRCVGTAAKFVHVRCVTLTCQAAYRQSALFFATERHAKRNAFVRDVRDFFVCVRPLFITLSRGRCTCHIFG